jgi:hypothetical protein
MDYIEGIAFLNQRVGGPTLPTQEVVMPDTLTIIDNRTGKQYEVPISHGTYPEYASSSRRRSCGRSRCPRTDFGL